MASGKVKWTNISQGYGFLVLDGNEVAKKDIFLHSVDVRNGAFSKLKPGDKVKFDIIPKPRGDQAINVILLDEQTEDKLMNHRIVDTTYSDIEKGLLTRVVLGNGVALEATLDKFKCPIIKIIE